MIAGREYNPLAADIWSCGVILYAMLCGYLPFEDPVTANLYRKIVQGEYSVPKFVTPLARVSHSYLILKGFDPVCAQH
jgi:5'-AMP-activated protein kinase catalytic alpha subunit